MSKPPFALVTGDIVRDCHLYGGTKTAATSRQDLGTEYIPRLGGAALSHLILAQSLAVMAEKKKASTPSAAINLPVKPHLGISDAGLIDNLPEHLHSFGVWTPHPPNKQSRDSDSHVWRVQKHFGYGPSKAEKKAAFAFNSPDYPPALILLDDGGILFCKEVSQSVWPRFVYDEKGSSPPFIVLKMSAPVCHGDLWMRLIAKPDVVNRLLVLVSADDLRREDAQIRRRLSWEQCAEDAVDALHKMPGINPLLQAAHVVVTFGSAGALWLKRDNPGEDHKTTLLFDPVQMEGEFEHDFDGTVYGMQSCVAVSIAHHVLVAITNQPACNLNDAVRAGITAGLGAKRKLLELGHGIVGKGVPGFPIEQIGAAIADPALTLAHATVPGARNPACPWTILTESKLFGEENKPLVDLAVLTAIHGRAVLSQVPCLSKGKLFTVDRSEIESLRTLERLIRDYASNTKQQKPLSIGVFGPPGAGKSFGVKALSAGILGKDVPILEFNLSQFKGPEDLVGALHRVRDEVLKGTLPVAFWDEFDSQGLKWLQYLLAPMQDGCFQEGQITHPIGKCIFIFAGGTKDTICEFQVTDPHDPMREGQSKSASAGGSKRTEKDKEKEEAWHNFKMLKGPDFISRLHGHLNVLGPNESKALPSLCLDLTWPIRRAIMLRSTLGLDKDLKNPGVLDMDSGLLHALLSVPRYRHGSRSFDKILLALAQDQYDGHYHRSAMLPDFLLGRETDVTKFNDRMNQATHPPSRIEAFAAAIHERYLHQAKANNWTVKEEVNRPFEELSAGYQTANRAAARRIPEHLALVGCTVADAVPGESDQWKKDLADILEKDMEPLAQSEHRGWCLERLADGWTFAETRNDKTKHHPALVEWDQLSSADKDKDRENIRVIPEILEMAKFKAVLGASSLPDGTSSGAACVIPAK